MRNLIIIAIVLFSLLFLYLGFYTSPKDYGEKEIFVVESGDGIFDISRKLEEKELVSCRYLFAAYVILRGERRDLKTGIYDMHSGMSISQVTEKLVAGKVKEDFITIVEGWNLNDIAKYLEEKGYGSKEEFYRLAGRPPRYEEPQKSGEIREEFAFLKEKPEDLPLEGYLFPDTYAVAAGAQMDDILKLFLANFKKKAVEEIGEEDIFETITIASLIEKEVISYEDKRLVSGIMRNRLKIGMPLQIDATITYLTGRRSVNIPILETRIKSPYNTYVNTGLPIGPISNPGIDSIRAAMDPKENDYFYYLSKPTGETVFSRTLEEHNYAKNKYLR